MVQNLGDIQGGMDVFGLDGRKIGIVTDVWISRYDEATPDLQGPVPVVLPTNIGVVETGQPVESGSGPERPDADAGVAVIAPTGSSTSYFRVESATGTYFVPFRAVNTCFPGQNATLDCTEQECVRLYSDVPS